MPKHLTYKALPLIPKRNTTLFLLLVISLFFGSHDIRGQRTLRDSLRNKIELLKKGKDHQSNPKYIDLLNELANKYRFVKEDSLLYLTKRALALSRTNNYAFGECKAMYNLGGYHSDNGKNQKAISYYSQALKLADSLQKK
ncbi:MAG: hypothetical protein AAF039_09965, partial [Bacteroidota bacterium]